MGRNVFGSRKERRRASWKVKVSSRFTARNCSGRQRLVRLAKRKMSVTVDYCKLRSVSRWNSRGKGVSCTRLRCAAVNERNAEKTFGRINQQRRGVLGGAAAAQGGLGRSDKQFN
jgi:hypothetical protein